MTVRFEDVIAWQKARVLINHVYRVTKGFPSEEKFGLTSQFQRAAVSIAANIAEGYKRMGKDDNYGSTTTRKGAWKSVDATSTCQWTSTTSQWRKPIK